ncbi:alpha/beta fold hydrolase BchO [Yoonia sp. R2331]|uniref:alpha/beta fold hydrolase BchO n=1 Tax=Yoonia sp. R2331 TaxID=3237238 RepID=UPI0034E42926
MRWPPPPEWPMADHSRQVFCRPHRWHVQEAGTGDTILLIHGAGGASQSWRGIFPILAKSNHVVAIDLPGQGFSQSGAGQRFGLPPMTQDLIALCHAQGWTPDHIVGHSAGAAIALQASAQLHPARITGINAALSNFKGVAGFLFPLLAKALAMTPLTASVFANTATADTVHRLIKGTGSVLTKEDETFYLRLVRDTAHVDATLSMMAQWDLDPLLSKLPQIATPTHFITGKLDTAVPPQTSADAAAAMPNARLSALPDLGHLAHEEAPGQIAQLILST